MSAEAAPPWADANYPLRDLERLARLAGRAWFTEVAPYGLHCNEPADQRPAVVAGIVRAALRRRDIGALREIADGVRVFGDSDDVPEAISGELVFYEELTGWLEPQAVALRDCLLRIEHACAIEIWSEMEAESR